MSALNHTHDANARSWVESANAANSDFPIQNLPHAVFRRAGSSEAFAAASPSATRCWTLRRWPPSNSSTVLHSMRRERPRCPR